MMSIFNCFNTFIIINSINLNITTPSSNKEKPFFIVREALPIPAAYTPTEQGKIVGIDEGVFVHAHSPGFEILPNGDALAIYFSAPKGLSESDIQCTFIQARLRFVQRNGIYLNYL